MNKLRLIIPSKDRATQLDCLVRSLYQYWNKNELDIRVLYKASSYLFSDGYNQFFAQYPEIHAELETDFCSQIKEMVESSTEYLVGFATDDCVLYRQPSIEAKDIRILFRQPHMHCFSLRHGENTFVQNYLTGE